MNTKNNFGNNTCKEIVENVCPYCQEHLIMNKRSFANHVRWCKQNPKYDEILNSTLTKLKSHTQKEHYTCNCAICNNEYDIYVTPYTYSIGKYKKTCSISCSKKLSALHTNKKQKVEKLSLIFKKVKYCKVCGKPVYKQNVYCSKECREYNRLKKKKKKAIYRNCCRFNFALNEYPDEFDFDLIRKYGWYKAKNHGNNLGGVSRDHRFSCNEGFKQMIDPYLISHPANCQLLKHNDNISKYVLCSLSLNELKDAVNKWNNKYGVYPNTINYEVLTRLGFHFVK